MDSPAEHVLTGGNVAGRVVRVGPTVRKPATRATAAVGTWPRRSWAWLVAKRDGRMAARGIQAIAVGRRAMHDQMLALGASCCIDYTSEDVGQRAVELAGGPVDAVADLAGGQSLAGALGALRPEGQIAAIATPELGLDPLLDANITFHGVLIHDDGQRTRELASLLAERSLRPVVSHLLPLSEAAQAHRILEGKHAGGKVVLTVPG